MVISEQATARAIAPAAAAGGSLAAVGEDARQAVADSLSPHTRRAYQSAWRQWQAWADPRPGRRVMPASDISVADYLSERAAAGASVATVRQAASAIAFAHRAAGAPNPCQSALVRAVLSGLSRRASLDGARSRQAQPLDADALAAIRATARIPRRGRGGALETAELADQRGAVDIALTSVLSDAGLRRSEAAALQWRDVERTGASGVIHVRRSKSDQHGAGAAAAITRRTMRALDAIRPSDASADDAPVFGLSASQISRRVSAAAQAAGLGAGYSGHSGRVGMAVRMARRGAPDSAIMRQGRWQSGAMVARYTRAEAAAAALQYLD